MNDLADDEGRVVMLRELWRSTKDILVVYATNPVILHWLNRKALDIE